MAEILTTDGESHTWITDIKEKDKVRGSYLVKEKKTGTTRRGEPFLSLILADRTGELVAKVWDNAQEKTALFSEGDILEIDGNAGSYRGQTQVTISALRAVLEDPDPGIFFETAPVDASQMVASLRKILRGVEDNHLKALLDKFLNDRRFMDMFKRAPAAKNFHHSYLGGLLEHTLSVCQMALRVAEHYPRLDRDLLVTAAFLHDIGKTRELKFERQIDYTDEGRLIGHLALGVTMLDEKLVELKGFPPELIVRVKHLILSHHGEYEFGSPKRPKFLEAFALHLIDDLDAKINGLGRFMDKDRNEGAWTDFNRLFERFFLKGEAPTSEEACPETLKKTDDRQGNLF